MQMVLAPLAIPGVYEIQPKIFEDERGLFVKTFQASDFEKAGLESVFKEEFYSVSKPNVIRGMHFQLPPYAHAKLVYCTEYKVLDVVLDLRKGDSYGTVLRCELDAEKRNMLYIPAGCAHGFLSYDKQATMVYHVTAEYHSDHDTGILWNSFDFDWGCDYPTVSARDSGFIGWEQFVSPF